MVQSFNLEGIKIAIELIFNKSKRVQWTRPTWVYSNITEIPFDSLKNQGFIAIAFDKDNTLTAPYELDIYPPFKVNLHS